MQEDRRETQDKQMAQEQTPQPREAERLSETWLELLGSRASGDNNMLSAHEVAIPTLESDPWSALIQANGVEVVEHDKHRLHITDAEVEDMLELMQERPDKPGSSSNQT